MKRILIILFIVTILAIAYYTKPDDKTIKEVAVKAVWGNLMPDKYKSPEYYEQFMDLNSDDVKIDDWIFFKHIKYKLGKKQLNIGIGAFKRVFGFGKHPVKTDLINRTGNFRGNRTIDVYV